MSYENLPRNINNKIRTIEDIHRDAIQRKADLNQVYGLIWKKCSPNIKSPSESLNFHDELKWLAEKIEQERRLIYLIEEYLL